MAEAVPEGGIERHLQQAAAAGRQEVTEWSERHTAPHFQTDLWFVVTDENGQKTRIPACHAVLNINCLFLHSFQAGDDVEIPHRNAGSERNVFTGTERASGEEQRSDERRKTA